MSPNLVFMLNRKGPMNADRAGPAVVGGCDPAVAAGSSPVVAVSVAAVQRVEARVELVLLRAELEWLDAEAVRSGRCRERILADLLTDAVAAAWTRAEATKRRR